MKTSRTPGAGAPHHTGREPHLLREIIRTYQALMSGFSREVGMPASRLIIMRVLANATQGEMGIMELARALGVNAAAVTRQVKEMESGGLALRRPDLRDGRRSHVKLSARGMKIFREIHERSHELETAISAYISTEEMSAAARVLAKLREFLEMTEVQRSAGKGKRI